MPIHELRERDEIYCVKPKCSVVYLLAFKLDKEYEHCELPRHIKSPIYLRLYRRHICNDLLTAFRRRWNCTYT